MSIAQRLNDAKFLYDNGRYDGALLSVLVAAAGTARRRHPQGTKPDGDAFREVVGEAMACSCQVFIEGKWHSLEHFLYKWLRCEIAHEAKLPETVIFQSAASPNEASILSGCPGLPGQVIVEHQMILVIGQKIANANENADLPANIKQLFSPT